MSAKDTAAAYTDEAQSKLDKAIAGAEDMLTQAAAATGDKAAELRERALEQLQSLRASMLDARATAMDKGKAAAYATDDFVHDNPWRSMLAAGAIGVAIGLLIGRR